MNFVKKGLVYFLTLSLIFPLTGPITKAEAASSCAGVTPMTDPLAIQMEKLNGNAVIWDGVTKELLNAKAQYEKLLKAKGWKIKYTSAYRPYQYQKHLFEVSTGTSSACKKAEISKHGLSKKVAAPSANAPHTKGIAFDAIVYDKNGKALNGMYSVSSSLITLAKQAGLYFFDTKNDGVHHQLSEVKAAPKYPAETAYNATGKITSSNGFNVRNKPDANATRIGGVYKNDTAQIVAKAGDWYKIKFANGYGYIMGVKSGVTIVPAKPAEQAYNAKGKVVTKSGLNVRNAPSDAATRIGGVAQNATVQIVAKSGEWFKIKFGNGYGWIFGGNGYVQIIPNTPAPAPMPTIKLATDQTFQKILTFTLSKEGGFVDNPKDPGGRTNKGITQNVYSSYLKSKKLPDKNVKYITDAQAKDIYYTRYWTPLKLNRMSEKLAMIMFDTAVNVGPNGNKTAGGAVKFLQQAMGVTADGAWGPNTEAAFKKQALTNHDNLAKKVMSSREAFRLERVKQAPSQKIFLQGWQNRDKDLRKFVGI